MSDRYLFRGKRISESSKNGKWEIGYYTGIDNEVCYIKTTASDYYAVNPETVCQCTGYECYNDSLCERGEEGKQLLFEADIISFSTFNFSDEDIQHIGVVYWGGGAYWVDCTSNEGDEGIYNLSVIMMGDDCVEIIGNIHDNPELMEKPQC